MIDLYKVNSTCSFSTILRSILLAGCGVYLRGGGGGGFYVSVATHVCTYTYAHRKLFPPALPRIPPIKQPSTRDSSLNGPVLVLPPIPVPFSFPLSVADTHSRKLHLLSLLFFSPLVILTLSTSVPVLVFVVPAVEVYVERHNAARRHAGDESPEGRSTQNVTPAH